MNPTVLYKLSYGLYVVTSKYDDKLNGQIANTAFQITSQPPTIAISINKDNLTHDYISKSGLFVVSILSQKASMQLIGKFGFKSGRDIDKLQDTKYRLSSNKIPIILDSCIAYLEAKVINQLDINTHTLFIGEIIDADLLDNEIPMTYDYYHKVKNGKSPKSAPTYVEDVKQKEGKKKGVTGTMKKYKCTVCGYVYDPAVGDEDSGIKPGTPFEDIPDDWTCPVCGVSKDDFEPIDE